MQVPPSSLDHCNRALLETSPTFDLGSISAQLPQPRPASKIIHWLPQWEHQRSSLPHFSKFALAYLLMAPRRRLPARWPQQIQSQIEIQPRWSPMLDGHVQTTSTIEVSSTRSLVKERHCRGTKFTILVTDWRTKTIHKKINEEGYVCHSNFD